MCALVREPRDGLVDSKRVHGLLPGQGVWSRGDERLVSYSFAGE